MCGVESLAFFLTWAVLEVERQGKKTLIVRGHPRRLRTEKRAKVTGNLLHVSGYQGANIIHTECWTHSWLNNTQNGSKNFLITSWSHEKRYQALAACTSSRSGAGKPGNEAIHVSMYHCRSAYLTSQKALCPWWTQDSLKSLSWATGKRVSFCILYSKTGRNRYLYLTDTVCSNFCQSTIEVFFELQLSGGNLSCAEEKLHRKRSAWSQNLSLISAD